MNKAFLSLGSNRGDRIANLNMAMAQLSEKGGNIIITSSLYETQPWKMEDKTDFFNQVLLLETNLSVRQLMNIIIKIEALMGRVRIEEKYEPRTIDIDILFFNDEIINTQELSIPHSLIQERRFVLEPLAEIAPAYIHPVFNKSSKELLAECQDKSRIKKSVSK